MSIYKEKGSNNEAIYEELCRSFNGKVELLDGEIICSSFTSVNHNKITIGLSGKIQDFLFGKNCEVYSEQIELLLGEDKFKPDVFVVCPKDNDEIKRKGESILEIPTIIFEVVSDSNASLDTIKKMYLYAVHGVKEYNLIYQDGTLTQYKLYEDYYRPFRIYNRNEVYKSIEMEDLEIDLNRIFYFIK
ncbi:MAG: Uma2 family endonuclease [Clostridium sp.]|uniref:Uma2 family endonuclease n=1 Tax=Clostridium sp. TaxID=1506 RepID=UPI003F3D5A27